MGSFDLTISAEDLATLQDVPQQIATLATNAQQALAAVRSGADSGNPVGALLSGLQTLGDEAAQLPNIDSLLGPIRDLAQQRRPAPSATYRRLARKSSRYWRCSAHSKTACSPAVSIRTSQALSKNHRRPRQSLQARRGSHFAARRTGAVPETLSGHAGLERPRAERR